MLRSNNTDAVRQISNRALAAIVIRRDDFISDISTLSG
jgi:hypothetical protein